jgi:hypothetical protein
MAMAHTRGSAAGSGGAGGSSWTSPADSKFALDDLGPPAGARWLKQLFSPAQVVAGGPQHPGGIHTDKAAPGWGGEGSAPAGFLACANDGVRGVLRKSQITRTASKDS